MAVTVDGRLSLSYAAELRGATGLVDTNRGLLKFSNGDFMGLKLKPSQFLQKGDKGSNRTHICSSLTADVATESKLRDLDAEIKDSRTVVAVILRVGAGARLFPLTKHRAKPAVPIGGLYRLIDVPMSNCINSGINKVYILTQFNSQSLNRSSQLIKLQE
ncbi:hypothetical protein QN277_000610 [Acacia crassicarpa]|uniref:glucose-1-phosphate adenylyltransferase n=1 Tax=Acacia crassicarpa TaxID=499986 RepID=A0AAE1THD3_9FABA|nr:hypothetical protein QN277_000610 [Acacia crassicarpa]